MTRSFLSQHCGIFAFWLVLCMSGIVGFSDGNETRNGSLPVLLSDQASEDDDSKAGCIDWEGKHVKQREKYVPNENDMCMRCTCDRRFPTICHSVACSPPLDCTNVKLISGACCEYECLDDSGKNVTNSGNNPSSENTESITNLSLRLIASTVTSLLFLALLLFMVHRLRQRRMLLAMRRFQARSDVCISDDMDGDPNIPDNFMSLECPPYTDPPPPYSPPKPPHILPGEQPPAYDEISIAENTSRELRSGSGQEERNPHETRLVRETGPVIAELHHALSQTNNFHQIYSSPQAPSFGVEMEMPRSPAQSQQNAPVNQNNSILPAYASTDILFRNATFSTMITPPHRQSDSTETPTPPQNTETGGGNGARTEAAGMPTLTAFQKFSSLFKRDKSKYKNRSAQQRRPVSEFIPPHYATLSRTHHTLTVRSPDDSPSTRDDNHLSNVTYRNNSSRNGSSRARSCYPNLTLADRMRLSYDSARVAYELAALSPSTSSNSSISLEQMPAQDGSITTACVCPSTTHATDVLPSSQSTTRHTEERSPVLLQEQMNVGNNSNSCHIASINHSPMHLQSVNSNVSQTQPHQTSGEFNTSSHFSSASKYLTNNVRNSPGKSLLSSHSSNHKDAPPTTHPYFKRSSRENEEHDSRENSLEGNRGNRIRNFNPNANSNSCVLRRESSPRGSPSVTNEATGHPGVFPPSPLPALGQMRRSHSSTSQASAFSICSETGEKKLKDDKHEADSMGKPLPSDCQYPPHPTSLSHSYNKSLKNNTPHSNVSLFRGHPYPPQVRRNAVPIPAPSPLDSDLQPATLVVPITSHLSLASDNAISSQNKHFRQKDLHIDIQTYGDDNLSSTAVQSSPISPPFVTVQSGKLISNPPPPAPAVDWTASRDMGDPLGKLGHENFDDGKRFRKKMEKDKRVSSLSFKPKDAPGSPSHTFKDVKSKYEFGNVKNKHSARLGNTKGASSRKSDKKRLHHFQTSASGSNVIDNSILPDFEDFSTPYGNADVYRSQACDPSSTSSFPVLSSPFHKFVDSNPDALQISKDCGLQDAKRNHTFPSPKPGVPNFGVSGHSHGQSSSSRHLQPNSLGTTTKYPSPQTRKKPGHKRQASSGNRNPNALGSGSANQKHNRSKSLTATDRIPEVDPATNDTAFEQVISDGRWVKSGFGHDLAFDDQSGGIDLGMSDRLADQQPYITSPAFKMTRGEGNGGTKNFDPSHVPEPKVATASVVPLPTRRRSGLSQDLSFVNRSEVNANPPKRLNKRSSLPGFLTFTSQQPQKNYCDSVDYVVAENFHEQETELPQKQLKTLKEKRDRSNSHDKNGRFTATSYV